MKILSSLLPEQLPAPRIPYVPGGMRYQRSAESPWPIEDFRSFRSAGDTVRTGSAQRELLFPANQPEPVRVMLYNMAKGKRGWQDELRGAVPNHDLALVQEATDAQSRFLSSTKMAWDYAANFEMASGGTTGLLNGGRAAPSSVRMMRSRIREPITDTSKLALLSTFPLPDGRTLLVVNVHAINFRLSTESYESYLQQLREEIGDHDGPMIVAGDFNAWLPGRVAAVEAFRASLGLKPVEFAEPGSKTFLGYPLDLAFVYGIRAENGRVLTDLRASDHRGLAFDAYLEAVAALQTRPDLAA